MQQKSVKHNIGNYQRLVKRRIPRERLQDFQKRQMFCTLEKVKKPFLYNMCAVNIRHLMTQGTVGKPDHNTDLAEWPTREIMNLLFGQTFKTLGSQPTSETSTRSPRLCPQGKTTPRISPGWELPD